MTRMKGADVCASSGQLAALATSWDELDTYLDAPFSKSAWALSCAETMAGDDELFVPVIRAGGQPIAAAALVLPRGSLGAARQLGVQLLGEPADFLYRDAPALARLAETLAKRRVPLQLDRMPSDSPLIAALRKAYGGRGLIVVRPRPDCPFVAIEGDEEATTARLSSRLRSDLRRAARKAEEFGGVSFETHAPTSEGELLPLWQQAVAVEASGWKGRSRSALQVNPRVGPFYRAYTSRACEQGILRVIFVKAGADFAAMMLALETSERLWILKIGYDERFAKCSPGLLVMLEALRYAARHELRSCEFLGTAEDWTRRWTELGRATQGVFIYPYTPRGAAMLIANATGRAWRKAAQRLRKEAA